MRETQLTSEVHFEGKLLRLRVDKVELSSGRQSVREVVEHPGAVAILPVTESGELVLVRQYRYAIERELLEIPAGTREPGETPESCAHRELAEEVGYQTANLEFLTRFFVSPGWCTEEMVVYRASRLSRVDAAPEEDEILIPRTISPGEIPGLMRDGTIADAKTITALLAHLANPIS